MALLTRVGRSTAAAAVLLACGLMACAGSTDGGTPADPTDPTMCIPKATGVTPSTGSARGGAFGTLSGRCMTAVATLYVGDARATVVSRESKTLTFITPTGTAGVQQLSYEYPAGVKVPLDVSVTYDALAPSFAPSAMPIPVPTADQRDAIAADFDGDGDMDVFIGLRGPGKSLYLQNDGRGVFTDVSATKLDMPATDAVGAAGADVDGDGDVDVFIANFDIATPDVLLRNNGGVLTADPAAVPADGSADHNAAFGDLDGDGDMDLFVVAYGADGAGHKQERVLINDGAGVFTELAGAVPARDDQTPGVALGDVDGDGDLDAVTCNDGAAEVGVRLLYGAGNGTFVDAPGNAIPSIGQAGRRPAFSDLDGDGDLDLVVAGTTQVEAYLNQGGGTFLWASTTLDFPTDMAFWNGVAIADMDLDGDRDVVMGGQGVPIRLLLNDGDGPMTDASGQVADTLRQSRTVIVADFNNDGAPDILTTDDGVTLGSSIYFSDGN